MGNILCCLLATNEDSKSNLIENVQHPQDKNKNYHSNPEEIIQIKDVAELRERGLEYRFVPCHRHAKTKTNTTKGKGTNGKPPLNCHCEECVTRLFHLNTVITVENRKSFIPDGSFFDEVARICQELTQERILKEYSMKFVTLQANENDDSLNQSKRIEALVSYNYDDDDNNKERPTLLIITGKGKSRAGILSVKHLLVSGMEVGSTMFPIRQAQRRGWDVVILDPNAWGIRDGMEVIEQSLNILSRRPTNRRTTPISILAHSAAGGFLVRYLVTGERRQDLLSRIQSIAFTDSTHRLAWARSEPIVHGLLQSPKCLYVRNNSLGSDFPHIAHKQPEAGRDADCDEWWRGRFGSLKTVWAGTEDHSLVFWTARHVIWTLFDQNLPDTVV
jgi:hypothetical protein